MVHWLYMYVWIHSLYKLETCSLVPLKALVLVSLVGQVQVREIALHTKGVFHGFLDKKLRFEIITETISANRASGKTFNWLLQGGDHIDVHHGRCANSLEFSCLLWQPVINFSALWNMSVPRQARYRTQLDFIRKTSWTSNDQSSNRSSRNSPRSTESL